MGQINLSDYKDIYLKTAKEYIDKMLSAYSKLSKDSQDKEAIIIAHLSSHSLKGQSQIMGFTKLVDLCESIEEPLENILKGAKVMDSEFLTFLKKSVDDINSELNLIEKGNTA